MRPRARCPSVRMIWFSVTRSLRRAARGRPAPEAAGLAESPDRHVGDALDAHQARARSPIARAPTSRSRSVSSDESLIIADPARRRERLEHLWQASPRAAARHSTACVRRSATTCRASSRSVPGSNVITTDERPGSDDRLDLFEERHTVQQVLLERHRDQLLDLLGRETERLGLDLDLRGRELRKDVGLRISSAARRRRPPVRLARATIRRRNFRLEPTIHRIMTGRPPRCA